VFHAAWVTIANVHAVLSVGDPLFMEERLIWNGALAAPPSNEPVRSITGVSDRQDSVGRFAIVTQGGVEHGLWNPRRR